MNCIVFDVLKESTSVPTQQLQSLKSPSPHNQGWVSQRFPIYPITLHLYLTNPPFNKISLCLEVFPGCMLIRGSQDSYNYCTLAEIDPAKYDDRRQIVYLFGESQMYHYLMIVIEQPPGNICKQVGIRAIEITNINIFGTRFVCSLKSKLKYSPPLFNILEVLEYKGYLYQQKGNPKYITYQSAIDTILSEIERNNYPPHQLPEPFMKKLQLELSREINQPMEEQYEYEEVQEMKERRKKIMMLQGELSSNYINPLIPINQYVQDYFHRFANIQIKQAYLRLLSSPQDFHQQRALHQFWSELRVINNIPLDIQEAAIMYFNYFLEFFSEALKVSSIKTFTIFIKRPDVKYEQQLCYCLERYMFNLLNQLNAGQSTELYRVSIKCVYVLYDILPNSIYVELLMKSNMNKLLKLEVLYRVTLRKVQINSLEDITQFLATILDIYNVNLADKNKVYNIAAYLSVLYGKESVIKLFSKYNSMIIISMQKVIDAKMKIMGDVQPQVNDDVVCQFCGVRDGKFKDENLYDLHVYKTCKYMHQCDYCHQIVEIPSLPEHYISYCQHRIQFTRCDRCNETLLKHQLPNHYAKCQGKLITKCPLCLEKVHSKLDLRGHLIQGKCPNNNR